MDMGIQPDNFWKMTPWEFWQAAKPPRPDVPDMKWVNAMEKKLLNKEVK